MAQIGGMKEGQVVSKDVYFIDIAYTSLPGQIEPLQKLDIYPNPTIGPVTIKTPGKFILEVIDPLGQILMQKKGNDALEIDLPDRQQHLFLLRITNEEGKVGTKIIWKK